jgi:hypothetical protein
LVTLRISGENVEARVFCGGAGITYQINANASGTVDDDGAISLGIKNRFGSSIWLQGILPQLKLVSPTASGNDCPDRELEFERAGAG